MLGHAGKLAEVIEAGLRAAERVATAWPTSAAKDSCGASSARPSASTRPTQWPTPASRPATWATQQGRAIHLLGPLAGKVIRVSPPLVMPLDEAREYFDAMYDIFAAVTDGILRSPKHGCRTT